MNENTILSEKKIKKYLRCAKKVSLLSDNKKTRVGCVVVYKNKIISVGHNYENKTNPLQKKYNELINTLNITEPLLVKADFLIKRMERM